MFGIGLGHQMLALSEDFKIEKMPQGHRGSNQPVVIKSTSWIFDRFVDMMGE